MNIKKERQRIVAELLNGTDREFTDEELMHELLDTSVSCNSEKSEKTTFGQRAADAVARFAGSWAFIFSFIAIMAVWMAMNVLMGARAFDGYPFILLNLVLSCIAAVQAPLIMMSQNRQEEKDRRRAENDYKVNLKTEIMIEDLHDKMNKIIAKQVMLEKLIRDDKNNNDKEE